jgi:IPT/TIG domain
MHLSRIRSLRRSALLIAPLAVFLFLGIGLMATHVAQASSASPSPRIEGGAMTSTPAATPAPGGTSTPTATAAPTSTAAPTATVAPTSTPAPTQTPAPTSTPVPTSTTAPTPTQTPPPGLVAPTLVSINPASGPAGTQVTLAGTNLIGVLAVNFGAAQGLLVGCSSGTACSAIAPPAPAGTTVNVTVVSAAGSSNGLPFTYSTSAIPAGGVSVTYFAGWNIVGGPTGTIISGSTGPLYTYQAGNTAYQTIPPGSPLTQPQGYWAYFQVPMSGTIPAIAPQTLTVSLPASQWIMIGNPGNTTATITGADVVYIYDGAQYQAVTTLTPGQGAWAISVAGGVATIAN